MKQDVSSVELVNSVNFSRDYRYICTNTNFTRKFVISQQYSIKVSTGTVSAKQLYPHTKQNYKTSMH